MCPWTVDRLTWFSLADVSKKTAFISSARRLPCSCVTRRSTWRSVLFPTKIMGTLWRTNKVKQSSAILVDNQFILLDSNVVHELFVDILANFEAVRGINWVHEDVAIDIDRVFGGENGVLILASGVDQQQFVLLTFDVHRFVESCDDETSWEKYTSSTSLIIYTVFNGGFVVVHELPLDELDGQRGLSWNNGWSRSRRMRVTAEIRAYQQTDSPWWQFSAVFRAFWTIVMRCYNKLKCRPKLGVQILDLFTLPCVLSVAAINNCAGVDARFEKVSPSYLNLQKNNSIIYGAFD